MRLLPLPTGESLLSWYGAGAVLLWPPLAVLTKWDWQGVENLGQPGEGRVVAVNHISWFDPFVVAQFLNDNGRSPRFMAKDALFDTPIGGQILKGAEQIPVYRESQDAVRAVAAAIDAVNSGESVVVYPEGTITRDPELWPMTGKTGAVRIALYSGKPLIPVAQWGANEIMQPYKLEANFWPRKTMRFLAGPPIDLDDLREQEFTDEVFAVGTNRLMAAITDLLAQLRAEESPTDIWDRRAEGRVPRGPQDLARSTTQEPNGAKAKPKPRQPAKRRVESKPVANAKEKQG